MSLLTGRLVLLVGAAMVPATRVHAAGFSSISGGLWSNSANWTSDADPHRAPGENDYVDVNNAMVYDTAASNLNGAQLQFYNGTVPNRGDLTLQRNLTASSFQGGGATHLGTFTLQADVISFSSADSTLSRSAGGKLIAGDNIGIAAGATITFTGDDSTPAAYVGGTLNLGSVGGNVTNFAVADPAGLVTVSAGYTSGSAFWFDIREGGTVRFVQAASDTIGLTIPLTGGSGSEAGIGIAQGESTGVLDLQFFDAQNPSGWALKWANPASGGDRISALQAWKNTSALKVNGSATWPGTVTMWNEGGFTYVGVAVPEPTSLAVQAGLALAFLGLLRHRCPGSARSGAARS